VKWVQSFLEELGIKNNLPTTIYKDNQAAIAYATTQRTLRYMKNIDIKYHFTRHLIKTGIIKLEYKSTEHMVADIFTKPLPISIHLYLTKELGLHYPRLKEECGDRQAMENEDYNLDLEESETRWNGHMGDLSSHMLEV
jgi:hypothetical protein